MSNVFTCVGNLGGDSTMEMAGNTPVLKFSVANNIGYGEKRTVMWVGCALFGTRGEKVQQYLVKGAKVMVTGELSQNEYNGKTYLNLNINDFDVIVQAPQNQQPQGQQQPMQGQQQPMQGQQGQQQPMQGQQGQQQPMQGQQGQQQPMQGQQQPMQGQQQPMQGQQQPMQGQQQIPSNPNAMPFDQIFN